MDSHLPEIHPTAVIDEGAVIGESTKIWHFSHVMDSSVIGCGCIIGQNVFVGSRVKIGNQVKVQNNVSLYEGVILEDDVFLGPSCVFTNVINPRSFVVRKSAYRKTIVKKGATIGANATIICGVTIGRYAMVGAGSVVTRDVPDHALVKGNPARQSGWISKAGLKLNFDEQGHAICSETGEHYQLSGNVVTMLEDAT